MKFSPTVTLAAVLAAGIAGAAMAQTTATPGTAPATPQTAAPGAQPQANAGPAQPRSTQQRQMPQGQMQQGQMQQGQMQQGMAAPGQTGATANPEVRQAQQQLRAAGLYNGPADGVMDPDTRAALARFQQQNGLQRTEDLDQQTLARLMSSQPAGSGSTAAAGQAPRPNAAAPTAPPAAAGGNAPSGQSMRR